MEDWERIGWLRTLIGAYDREHDWCEDEDPSATSEMLRECRNLADELESELPAKAPRLDLAIPSRDGENIPL